MSPTELTPEQYDRAVRATRVFLSEDGGPDNLDFESQKIMARALLLAHAQRRTEGTVQVCKKARCRLGVPDGWTGHPLCEHESIDGGFYITKPGCPLRKGTP